VDERAKELSDMAVAREAAKRERSAARRANPQGYVRYVASVSCLETGIVRWTTVRGGHPAALRALVEFLVADGSLRRAGSPAAAGKPAMDGKQFHRALYDACLPTPRPPGSRAAVTILAINDGKEVAQVAKATWNPI
jgi:hypothetical protein